METITMWGLLWDWSICGKLCGKLFRIGECGGKLLGDLGVEKFVDYIIYKKEGRLGSGNVVRRIKEGRLFFLKSGDCGFWGLMRRRVEEVLEILGKNISRLFFESVSK